MKTGVSIILSVVWCPLLLLGQTSGNFTEKLLSRHYKLGQRLSYHMKATNKDRRKTESYEVDAIGVVKKDSEGNFYEEYQWTNFVSNGEKITLPPTSQNYRQDLSLDPHCKLPTPRIDPLLVGPILDLFTFYADLRLAIQNKNLAHAGDHFYFKYGKPASWANGAVILGEDSVDFDVTLQEINPIKKIAIVAVRHVPPAKPEIKIPVGWMNEPITNAPNNWVQVTKAGDKYIAAIGNETFDCEIKVSLIDGRILSAKMDNPVEVMERECTDKTLVNFGGSVQYQIHRQIEIY